MAQGGEEMNKKSEKEVRNSCLTCLLTKTEKDRVEKEAHESGMTLSTWVRYTLNKSLRN